MRRRAFKSVNGWMDFCTHEAGLRERRKNYPQGSFSYIYDKDTRRTWAEGVFLFAGERYDQWFPRWEIFMSDLLKKAIQARKESVKAPTEFEPEPWMHKVPIIEQWLKITSIDGKRRETATLTLTFDRNQCKIMLKDRQSHELAWSTADTFLEALLGLEERLAEGTVEWQEDKLWKQGNGKK